MSKIDSQSPVLKSFNGFGGIQQVTLVFHSHYGNGVRIHMDNGKTHTAYETGSSKREHPIARAMEHAADWLDAQK